MKNVAFIPVRGGSKSIPLKNIKMLNNKPLVYWTMKAAAECRYIEKVYISTDSKDIFDTIEELKKQDKLLAKVEVIGRSDESATDTASTEFVMLEFAASHQFENIALIQATSPLLTSFDLDCGFETFSNPEVDSVLSTVRQKRFNWKINEKNFAEPANYNIFKRPRRQEFEGYLVENGAFYITSRELLISTGNRISGNIKASVMPENTYYEIDEPGDWNIIEGLLKKRMQSIPAFQDVRMFLTDCDGCLTDGGMYYGSQGEVLKKFNTRDGMGIQRLREKGIITGIITGENTDIVKKRAEKLMFNECELGVRDKLDVIKNLSLKYDIPLKHIAYVGDDINDLDALKSVGIPCCVNNAAEPLKEIAVYITDKKGGEGAIREIADRILE